MKNTLLDIKPLRSCNNDARLPTNDFLELVIMNKLEEGEFTGITNQLTEIFERSFYMAYDDSDEEELVYSDLDDDNYSVAWERLRNEFGEVSHSDTDSTRLLYAGYVDCMDEAIRFLVEEENISPEHPAVINLKAHLEKSKEKILNSFGSLENVRALLEAQEGRVSFPSADNIGNETSLASGPRVNHVQDWCDSG